MARLNSTTRTDLLRMLLLIPCAIVFALGNWVACNMNEPSSQSDTTSHAFVWTFESIGESGRLYDVCIVNDTLAYAVGSLYIRDSLGQWEPQAYNVVRWNGRTWTMLRVRVFGSCSNVEFPPLFGVWAISADEIFMTHGGGVAKFDGASATLDCRMRPMLTGNLERIFAVSSVDIYSAGGSGTLVHYDGIAWTKIETGTDLTFRDIFGARHPFTHQLSILALASGSSSLWGKKLVQIEGNSVFAHPDSGLGWQPGGLWFVPTVKYYIGGPSIYWKKNLDEEVWEGFQAGDITTWATSAIRGNSPNDIVAVGDGFELLHYNGSTWCNFRDQVPSTGGIFLRVAIKNNLAITVGFGGNRGAIAVGRR